MLTIAIGGCSSGESKLELSHSKSVFFIPAVVLLVEEKRLDRVRLRVRFTDARERRAGRVFSQSPC